MFIGTVLHKLGFAVMWSTYGLGDNLDPQNVFEDGFSFHRMLYHSLFVVNLGFRKISSLISDFCITIKWNKIRNSVWLLIFYLFFFNLQNALFSCISRNESKLYYQWLYQQSKSTTQLTEHDLAIINTANTLLL